jgi:hypothetical protein
MYTANVYKLLMYLCYFGDLDVCERIIAYYKKFPGRIYPIENDVSDNYLLPR